MSYSTHVLSEYCNVKYLYRNDTGLFLQKHSLGNALFCERKSTESNFLIKYNKIPHRRAIIFVKHTRCWYSCLV